MRERDYYEEKKDNVEFLFDVAQEGKWLDYLPPDYIHE